MDVATRKFDSVAPLVPQGRLPPSIVEGVPSGRKGNQDEALHSDGIDGAEPDSATAVGRDGRDNEGGAAGAAIRSTAPASDDHHVRGPSDVVGLQAFALLCLRMLWAIHFAQN